MAKSQAEEYYAKAEKKSSSSVGWFGSSSSKWEEAGDLFQHVSHSLKPSDDRQRMPSKSRNDGENQAKLLKGGQIISIPLTSREAACRQHANEMNDAMNAFHNAAKSYKKSDPEGGWLFCFQLTAAAVTALHQTIKLLVQAGNFRQAADREKEVSLSL